MATDTDAPEMPQTKPMPTEPPPMAPPPMPPETPAAPEQPTAQPAVVPPAPLSPDQMAAVAQAQWGMNQRKQLTKPTKEEQRLGDNLLLRNPGMTMDQVGTAISARREMYSGGPQLPPPGTAEYRKARDMGVKAKQETYRTTMQKGIEAVTSSDPDAVSEILGQTVTFNPDLSPGQGTLGGGKTEDVYSTKDRSHAVSTGNVEKFARDRLKMQHPEWTPEQLDKAAKDAKPEDVGLELFRAGGDVPKGQWEIHNKDGKVVSVLGHNAMLDLVHSKLHDATTRKLQSIDSATVGFSKDPKYQPKNFQTPDKPAKWTYHKQDDGTFLATNDKDPSQHHTIDTTQEGTTYKNYGGTVYKQTVKGKNVTSMEKAPPEMQPDHNVVTSTVVDGKEQRVLYNPTTKQMTKIGDGKDLPQDKPVAALDENRKPVWYDPKTGKMTPSPVISEAHKRLLADKSNKASKPGMEVLRGGGATFSDPRDPNGSPARIPIQIIVARDEQGNTTTVWQYTDESRRAMKDLRDTYQKEVQLHQVRIQSEKDVDKQKAIQTGIDFYTKSIERLDKVIADEQKKVAQPTGAGNNVPATTPAPVAAPAATPQVPPRESRVTGQVYTLPKGDYIWRGNGWEAR